MSAQRQLANAFGGIGRTTSINTPKTQTVASWQTGSPGYSDRFSGVNVQQPPPQQPQQQQQSALLAALAQAPGQQIVDPSQYGAQQWQQPAWGMDQGQAGQIQTGIEAPYLQQPGTPQTPDLPS